MADEKPLTLEEAIKTALEFENRVRDTYLEAVRVSSDQTGRRVFGVLAREEQDHVDYLESRLDEWRKSGKITAEALTTAIPSREKIEAKARELKTGVTEGDRSIELRMLQRAVEAEKATSGFYRKMVDTMKDEEKVMFENFLKIEEGHLAIVQAELDAVSGDGFFFEFGEFNLEAE